MSETNNPIVFISHSHSERDLVMRMVSFLEQRAGGACTFFYCTRDVQPGCSWQFELIQSLDSANLTIALFSNRALGSDWVMFEVGYARGRKIPVIPVALPGVQGGDIPNPISSTQAISLHSASGLSRLLASLNVMLELSLRPECSSKEFELVVEGRVVPLPPPPSGMYRVFVQHDKKETGFEAIEVTIQGHQMTVRSDEWICDGRLRDGVHFVGTYYQPGNPDFLGIHELNWNGKEFRGTGWSHKIAWTEPSLIWRPIQP